MTPRCDPEKTICINKIQISSITCYCDKESMNLGGPNAAADYALGDLDVVVKRSMSTPDICGGGGKPPSSYFCGDCECDGEGKICKGIRSPAADSPAKERGGVDVFRESNANTSSNKTDHLAKRTSTDSLTAVSSTDTGATDDSSAAAAEMSMSDAAARRLKFGGEERRSTLPSSRDVFNFDDCEGKGGSPVPDNKGHATNASNPSVSPREAAMSPPSTAIVGGATTSASAGGRSATTPPRPPSSSSRTAPRQPSPRRRSIFGDYWRNSRVATTVEIANAVSGRTGSPPLSPARADTGAAGANATAKMPTKDGDLLEARRVIEMQKRMQRSHEVREQERAMEAAASTYSVDCLDQAEYSTHTGRLYTERSFLDSHHHLPGGGSTRLLLGPGASPGGQPSGGGGGGSCRSPFLFNPVFGSAGAGAGKLLPAPSLSEDRGDTSVPALGLAPRPSALPSERRMIPRPNPLRDDQRSESERSARPTELSATHDLKLSALTPTAMMGDNTVAPPHRYTSQFSPLQSFPSSTASLSSPPSSLTSTQHPSPFHPKSILRKPRIGKRGSHRFSMRRSSRANRSSENIYTADPELWKGRDSTCGKTNAAWPHLGQRRGSFDKDKSGGGGNRSRRNSHQDAGGAIDPDHESIFNRPGSFRIPQHLEGMPHPNHDHFPFGGSPPHRAGLLSPSMASPDASVRRGSLGARINHVHYDPRVCIVEYLSDSEDEEEEEGGEDVDPDGGCAFGMDGGGPIGALLGGYRRAQRERDEKGEEGAGTADSAEDESSRDGSDDGDKVLRVPDSSSKWFTNEELTEIRLNAIRDAQQLLIKTNKKTPDGITSPPVHLRASSLGWGAAAGVRGAGGGNRAPPSEVDAQLLQAEPPTPPTKATSHGGNGSHAVPLAIFGGGHLNLSRSSSDPTPATARRRALFTNPILRVTPDDNVLLEGSPELSAVLASHVRRILVVEPHPAMRSLFERGVRHIMPHADVTVCSSAEEALEVMDEHTTRVCEQGWLADSDDEKKDVADEGRGDCAFDIVIVEERLTPGSSARLMQSSDDIHALEKNAPNDGDGLLQRSRSQSKIEHAQKHRQRRRGMPMSGSRLLHHLSLSERKRAEVDGGLCATEAGVGPPPSDTSPLCFRPSLLIGVSSSLAEDGEKLTKAGADLLWGKPPPKMDTNLRNQMVMTLLEKRGEPTMICG